MGSFFQWFICFIIGILFCSVGKSLLIDYTLLDEMISENLTMHFGDSVMESSAYQSIPDVCSGWIDDHLETIQGEMVESITSIMMTVISFLIIMLTAKAVTFIYNLAFSKDRHRGVTGFVDRMLGGIFGFARGIFYVLVIFLIFVPVFSVWFPSSAESFAISMEDSFIAGIMYNDNAFLVILKEFFA